MSSIYAIPSFEPDFHWDEKKIEIENWSMSEMSFFSNSELVFLPNFKELSNMNDHLKMRPDNDSSKIFFPFLSSKYVYFKTSHIAMQFSEIETIWHHHLLLFFHAPPGRSSLI